MKITIKPKQMLALVLGTLLSLMPLAFAASESVYTTIYWNIASVDAFTVTLLGEDATTSAPAAGTATAKNIEFNSSTGTTSWDLPSVTGGGSEQGEGTPIITIDNTGTTNLMMNISIDSAVAECMGLNYDTSWHANGADGITLSTTEITLDASFTPAESAIALYLWGNFSDCAYSDATTRTLTINGTTV